MNSSEKTLLDVALVALVIVLVWTGLRRKRRDEQNKEPC
jgi:uncharacterized membrane-anchored protein